MKNKKIILAIGAHPDDIEIGCAGTLHTFADQDASIYYIIASLGEKCDVNNTNQNALLELRKTESLNAASHIGVKDITYMMLPDTFINHDGLTVGSIEKIIAGQAEVVIAGGVECTSDSPILFNKPMRKKLMGAQKLKGLGDTLKFILSLRPKDFVPEAPAIAEYITDRIMGYDCELLASKFKISREEQDQFAVRSHQLAAKAHEEGLLDAEIVPVELPPKFNPITVDNGVRGDSTMDKAAKLKPAFVKPYGTITAANSSFLTDGATAILIMTEDKAKELGFTPLSYVKDYAYSGQDLHEELLLGPAYAISKVLKQTGLELENIDVIELHEAFAGQVLSNLKALASEEFSRNKLGWDKAVGQVNMDKLNTWGGSLSLGHPFGATGARLATTASNRLIKENGKYALLAACAAGAHGHAMILERYAA